MTGSGGESLSRCPSKLSDWLRLCSIWNVYLYSECSAPSRRNLLDNIVRQVTWWWRSRFAYTPAVDYPRVQAITVATFTTFVVSTLPSSFSYLGQ